MKTSQAEQKKRNLIKRPILVGSLVLGVVIVVAAYLILVGMGRNYAKETVKPLETGLIDGGAVEKCTSGDAGRGPDNRAPNYTAVFQTSLDRNKASELVKQIASNNGYKLNEADSAYTEIISYYDHAKQSPYNTLKSGPILLGLSLYDGGSHLGCANTKVDYDKGHTAIKMDVSLPEYK
jgi:hypothetical protein